MVTWCKNVFNTMVFKVHRIIYGDHFTVNNFPNPNCYFKPQTYTLNGKLNLQLFVKILVVMEFVKLNCSLSLTHSFINK